MYADDLTLVASSEAGLQKMLNSLAPYAARKHLTVNVPKSKVMVFNSKATARQPSVHYLQQQLSVVPEFKFLGTMFDRCAKPSVAAVHLGAGMFGAMRDVFKLAGEYGVQHHPQALLHLIRTFVLPHAMYGSQVWSTAYLSGDVLQSPPQARMLSFYKSLLGVRRSVAGDIVLHELCQPPLQFYWLRSLCRFWNAVEKSGSQMLQRVAMADVALAQSSSNSRSWSAEFMAALRSHLGNAFTGLHSPAAAQLTRVDTTAVCTAWTARWGGRWQQYAGNPQDPATAHRERSTYSAWFREGEGMQLSQLPQYLRLSPAAPSVPIQRSMVRLRVGNHGLNVEQGRFHGVPFNRRFCVRCGVDREMIDDVQHLLFLCDTTQDLRLSFADAFPAEHAVDVRRFVQHALAPTFVHVALKRVAADALVRAQQGPAAS
jgi:hypothetical protein